MASFSAGNGGFPGNSTSMQASGVSTVAPGADANAAAKMEGEQQVLSPTDSVVARTVLEITLSELHLMMETSPDVAGLSEQLNKYVGDAVSAIVQRQHQINADYEEAIRVQEEHRQRAINKPIGAPTKEDRQLQQTLVANAERLGESLKSVTKVLCGDISSNSDIVNNLQKVQRHRSELLALLEGLIDDLALDGGYSTLAGAVEKDVKQEEERAALVKRHTALTKDLARVKKAIKETDETLKALRSKAEAEVQSLTKKLSDVKLSTKLSVTESQRTTQGTLDFKLRGEGEEVNALLDKVDQLGSELAEEKASSAALLEHMTTRVKGAQSRIDALQAKFNETQQTLEERIDELQEEIAQLTTELLALRKQDEANKETRREWEEFAAFRDHAEQSLAEAREARKHDAVTAILKSWRDAILPPLKEPPKAKGTADAKTAKKTKK